MNKFKKLLTNNSGATLLEALVAVGLFTVITAISLNTQNTVRKHKNQLRDKFNSAKIVNEIYRQLQDQKNCECNFVKPGEIITLDSVDSQGNPFFSFKSDSSDPYDSVRLFTGGDCNVINSVALVDLDENANSIYNDTRGSLIVDDVSIRKVIGDDSSEYQTELVVRFYNRKFNQGSTEVSGLKFLERRFKLNANINADNEVVSCYSRETALYKTIKMRLCPDGEITYDDTRFEGDESQLALDDRYKCSRDTIAFDNAPVSNDPISHCYGANGKVGYLTIIKDEPGGGSPDGDGVYSYDCVEQRDLNLEGGIAAPQCASDERITGFTALGVPICRRIIKQDLLHLYETYTRSAPAAPITSTDLQFQKVTIPGAAGAPDIDKFRIRTLDEVP